MKSLKKILSIFAAFMMVVGLTMTNASAAGKGSITIENPVKGKTYNVYKIFDVTYPTSENNETPTKYAYSIDGNSPWFSTVNIYASNKDNGLTLTKAAGVEKYTVVAGENFNAADFAKTLNEALNNPTSSMNPTAAATLPNNNSYTASNLDLGYYFVSSGNGSLCNLTTTNPHQDIVDKNDVPFEKTADGNVTTNGAQVGQVINYVIEGKIPYTEGFETYTYKVSDWMTEGLTFNKDVKLYVVDGTTETEISATVGDVTNYTLTNSVTVTEGETSSTKTNGFTMDIMVQNLQAYKNQTIRIKYSATVNDAAVTKVDENNAKLEYTNNADGTTTSTEKQVKTFSAKIVIDKYAKNEADETDKSTKLSGAEFILRRKAQESTETNRVYEYYKYTEATPATPAKVEWVSENNKAQATKVTTDTNGAASFNGLKNGSYQLIETKAPDGYNLATEPINVTIDGNTDKTLTDLTATSSVMNETGSTLPSTGGMGTTMIYIAGAILMVGAAIIFVTNKRMKHE